MSQEILSTKKFFEENHITLCNEWLESCINWYKQENENTTYTAKELQTQVYEQWLLLDFRDVNIPILPPNVLNEKKHIINKNICLQVMQVIDISKPKLWQIQKIRNTNIQNTEQDVMTGKRVLQLTLTDGVQEILATEYKPISFISLNLTPGIKVRLNSPIIIRRGQIMLESNSIKILGGEVEELLLNNAAENVLAKILNLPLNNTPVIVEETFENADKDIINKSNDSKPVANKNYKKQCQSSITDYTSKKANIEHFVTKSRDFTMEEERLIDEEINMILEAERIDDRKNQVRKTPNVQKTTPDLLFDDDFDAQDFDEIDKIAACGKINNNTTKSSYKKVTPKQNTFNEDFDDDEFDEMCAIERELSLNKPSTSTQISKSDNKQTHDLELNQSNIRNIYNKELVDIPVSKPIKKKPMTIKDLLKLKGNVTKGKFKVHARFKNVVQKLTIAGNAFSLKGCIEDDTADMIVAFHSDVIADLMEFTVEAIEDLKRDVVENNDSCKATTIYEAIDRVKTKLLMLDNVVDILIEGKNEPTVVGIL